MTQELFHQLRTRLETLRNSAREGQLREAEIWSLLKDMSTMLDRASGTPNEATLRVIYSLVEGVWTNVRTMDQLKGAMM